MAVVKSKKTKDKNSPPQDMAKKYLTVPEIAQYLNVTESWIYKLKAANKIPFIQLEGKILFDIQKINDWLSEKSSSPVNG